MVCRGLYEMTEGAALGRVTYQGGVQTVTPQKLKISTPRCRGRPKLRRRRMVSLTMVQTVDRWDKFY